MTRFVSKLAVGATAVALTALTANAAHADAVDPNTGPVSYAAAATVKWPAADNQPGGFAGGEYLQRSPLQPGTAAAPWNQDVVQSPAWSVGVDYDFGDAPASDYPPGLTPKPKRWVHTKATLENTLVPDATVDATYEFKDAQRTGGSTAQQAVLFLQDSVSSVNCSAPDHVTSSTAANGLWLRQPDDSLKQLPRPR